MADSMAASGSNTAARFTPFDCFIERPKKCRIAAGKSKVGGSGGFLHLAGTDARRADTHLLLHARHDCVHAFQIRIPPPPARVVRVAHHVSIMRPFAAKITLQCHCFSCLLFILAWIVCTETSKTKLLILADPLPPTKYGFLVRMTLRLETWATNAILGSVLLRSNAA